MTYIPNGDYGLSASLGLIAGVTTLNKFGEGVDCDSGVPTDVWDGANGSISTAIWAPPTEARIHQITSSSANDTSAGTGARTIRVYGLEDWDTAESSEDVIMNGVSDVATSRSYVIIHRIKALTWGSGGVNAGDITATADTDSTITAAIIAGQNQTQMCIYGVPSTQKLRLTEAYGSLVKGTGVTQRADGELLMMVDPSTNASDNTAWTNKENFLLVEGNPPWRHEYNSTPKKFDGPCIIKIQVTSNSNGTKVIGALDAFVVDN